jgi:methionyl-tRNA formyltransferase
MIYKSKKKKKVLFVGNLIISKYILNILLKSKKISICGILTCKNKFNSDYYNLETIAKKKKIPIFKKIFKNLDKKKEFNWMDNLKPDWIIVVGWSYLLKGKILTKYKNRIIGYHPSDLPNNRGRHPLIWSIFLNIKKIGSTFFLIDKGIDEGHIVSKKYFYYNGKIDTMKKLYFKMIKVACVQMKDIVNFICLNKKILKIKNKKGNFWRKRNINDGKIDWRMPSEAIKSLVNALSWPYIGAHFLFNSKNFKVHSVKIINNKEKIYNNIEPGKVIKVDKKYFPHIKTLNGVVKISNYEPLRKFNNNDYII